MKLECVRDFDENYFYSQVMNIFVEVLKKNCRWNLLM